MSTPDQQEPAVAVLLVHGIGIKDSGYADGPVRLLRRQLVDLVGPAAAGRVHVRAAYWKPAVADRQDELVRRAFPPRFSAYARGLDRLVRAVDRGGSWPLLPLAASGLLRYVPGLGPLHWPTSRWALSYLVGDVIAYQGGLSNPTYREVHRLVDEALSELAELAPTSPLVVVAHSLGTVIASDHFYDRQQDLTDTVAPTPLERGETLTCFYTLGSPIALWLMRHPSLDRPVELPGRDSADARVRAGAEWVNVYDPDDVVAFPLRGLSPQYAHAVDRDEAVDVGPRLLASTPVSHIAYWNDPAVIGPIARTVAGLVG
ncbi:MAG: hypothetical protein WB441_06005 [Nocardioidaceae bacterium]